MINNIEVLTKEEQYVFWLVLADTQWNNGNLLENVKKEALSVIKNKEDLKRWTDQKELEKRKKELLKLEEKLKQNPKKKKLKKTSLIKSIFEIGDILLYQIKNEKYRKTKWYNKCVLLRVVDIYKEKIGRLAP